MELYKLALKEKYFNLKNTYHYDIVLGFVISARDEKEAREEANKNHGDENSVCLNNTGERIKTNNIWLNSSFTSIKKIGTSEVKKGIVLRSFNAG